MSASVIGRDCERSCILDFVESCEKSRKGGVMYCAGPPGTGKTLCTNHVLENWLNAKSSEGLSHRVEYLNVINLNDHMKVFAALESIIRKASNQKSQPRKRARLTINTKFVDASEPFALVADCYDSIICAAKEVTHPVMCVYILDEIDYLCSSLSGVVRGGSAKSNQAAKKQIDLISSLFTLPHKLHEHSNVVLCIIGIANSIDLANRITTLTSRMVKSKSSSIDKTLLFRPYDATELKNIVLSMTGSELDPMAVELCSRKVAAIHGDCRKVIDLCKQAKNISNAAHELESSNSGSTLPTNSSSHTTIKHLMTAMDKAYKSQAESVVSLKSLPLQQLLVLVAACMHANQHSDKTEFGIMELKKSLSNLVSQLQIPTMVSGQLSSMMEHVTALNNSGLMTLRTKTTKTVIGKDSVFWRLNCPSEQLGETLKQTNCLIKSALETANASVSAVYRE